MNLTSSAGDRELVLTRVINAPHEKMGFHQGWGQATDQLEALVAVS